MKKGTWLHKKLDEVTTENWCIDINKETCDYLKEKWNRKDVICADVLTDGDYIKSEIGGKKDWILLADVIEHTVDPIGFLKAIKENKLAKKIIITVPNAFHFVNMFIAYKKNAEVINSDHKFWFTPYTLLKCCNEAGINVEEIDFCGFNVKGHKLPRLICKDIMASTIFVVGSL